MLGARKSPRSRQRGFILVGKGRALLGGKPRPTLDLNFLSGALDSRITASGGANGYVVGPSGLLVPATTPRFDYDPVTLAAKGLLVEEQRTNLFLQSAAFDNAGSWGTANATVTANTTTAPDGTLAGDTLTDNATLGQHQVSQSVNVTSGQTYVLSAYVKQGTAQYARLALGGASMTFAAATFDLQAGTQLSGTGSITPVGGGWYRITASSSASATGGASFSLGITNAGGTTYSGTGQTLTYWGAQLEAGSFATSYIPTTSAQVTRTADSLVMTGTNFSSWFNAAQGTMYAEGDSLLNVPSGVTLFRIDDGSSANELDIRFRPSATGAACIVSSVAQADLAVSGLTPGAVYKMAFAFAANDFSLVSGGGAPVTDSSGSIPSGLSRVLIGNAVNGHIRRVRFYQPRLPNATLQSLTQ